MMKQNQKGISLTGFLITLAVVAVMVSHVLRDHVEEAAYPTMEET